VGNPVFKPLYSKLEYDKVLEKVGGGVIYNILYSRMEYDKVLEKVGGFGLYQKFLCYVLVFYTTFLCGINFYTQVRILQLISSYNRQLTTHNRQLIAHNRQLIAHNRQLI